MVHGYHVIMSFYGFWLPNDPRGSWSTWIRQWELLRFGPATKVETRHSVARVPYDRSLRRAAKAALKYPPVVLNGKQALAVGLAFKAAIAEGGYRCYACSLLPEHVHLTFGRHDRKIEQVLTHLRSAVTRKLNADGLNPLSKFKTETGYVPTPWAHGVWKVYLNSPFDVNRAIRYVENNPLKEGKPRQTWSMVAPYRYAHLTAGKPRR